MLELTRFTNTIKKKNQHNTYNQDFRHAKKDHVDDTHDDRYRIIEAIQDRHDYTVSSWDESVVWTRYRHDRLLENNIKSLRISLEISRFWLLKQF